TIRQFEIAYEQAADILAVIRQAAIGTNEKRRLEKDTLKLLKRMEKCCAHSVLEQHDKSKLQSKLKRLQGRFPKLAALESRPKAFKRLRLTERQVVERLVSLIYECSPNKGAARR